MSLLTEIEDTEKKYLGGWRNLVTGKEYHDGECQTILSNKKKKIKLKNSLLLSSKITQTSDKFESKYTSSYRDINIQTSNLPDLTDKLLTPTSPVKHHYFPPRITDKQRETLKQLFLHRKYSILEEESAIKIQKFFRACRTKTEISSLARFAVVTRKHVPMKENLVKLDYGNNFKIVEHCPPHTRSDFDMLNNILDRWRILENKRIDRTLFGSSKIIAKSMILNREIEVLRTIEIAKMKVNEEKRERDNLNYLEKLAEPEIWRTKDGKKMEVETLRVSRARECRDMYRALIVEMNENRLDTLKSLKNFILGHTCEKSHELEYLIDQEIDLLSRNISDEMMKQLRNRLKFAFFQFSLSCCEPSDSKIQEITKFCIRCKKLLSTTNFQDDTKKLTSTCENCLSQCPTKDPKILYEPYEQMLKELRKSEARLGSINGLAFKIGAKILHHLVNIIWHGKSGISEFDDLFSLRLLRFRADTEWSPWNSILLTKREAAIHQAMTNPWELYESSLVKRFLLRNLQAKLCFESLVKY